MIIIFDFQYPLDFRRVLLLLCTKLYDVIIGIVVIIVGAFVGNYVQQNKSEVKEKLKNFIDKI